MKKSEKLENAFLPLYIKLYSYVYVNVWTCVCLCLFVLAGYVWVKA